MELIGFLAGALIILSFIPQLFRLFKLKSAREISLPFTALLTLGVICWLIYGIYFKLTPIILWNSLGLVQSLVMLYFKLKYGK